MKAKIIIEDGRTFITLTPENQFEKTLIENMEHRDGFDFEVYASTDYGYGFRSKHQIEISIIKKQPTL